MTTEKQAAANQTNAQKSTGPRTPEGKAASSLNGIKHNLNGLMRLLPDEDHDEYVTHCEGVIATLKPASPLEAQLVNALADDYWRIERIRRIEQRVCNNALSAGDEPDPKIFNLYSLYESRLNRNIKNNMAEFRKLRDERFHEEAEFQREQANNAHLVSEAQVRESPLANGFAYSSASAPDFSTPRTDRDTAFHAGMASHPTATF